MAYVVSHNFIPVSKFIFHRKCIVECWKHRAMSTEHCMNSIRCYPSYGMFRKFFWLLSFRDSLSSFSILRFHFTFHSNSSNSSNIDNNGRISQKSKIFLIQIPFAFHQWYPNVHIYGTMSLICPTIYNL